MCSIVAESSSRASGTVAHDRLLDAIVACPSSWYDATPSGRILNRSGEDQMVLDWALPLQLEVRFHLFHPAPAADVNFRLDSGGRSCEWSTNICLKSNGIFAVPVNCISGN